MNLDSQNGISKPKFDDLSNNAFIISKILQKTENMVFFNFQVKKLEFSIEIWNFSVKWKTNRVYHSK
jgi:hypothetical protein